MGIMDKLTPEQRRKCMQSNKSTGTKIEVAFGKAMFAKGLRYRKNNKKVFGTPDFTFKKYKVAIFADGDFWHGKDWETRKKKLGTNAGYWFNKIETNLERDFKVNRKLKEDGWLVLRFWESDLKNNLDEIVNFVFKVYEERKKQATEIKILNKGKIVEKYLENKQSSSLHLKEKAVSYTKDLLKYKYPEDDFSSQVAEEMLRYGVGKNKSK